MLQALRLAAYALRYPSRIARKKNIFLCVLIHSPVFVATRNWARDLAVLPYASIMDTLVDGEDRRVREAENDQAAASRRFLHSGSKRRAVSSS